MHTVPYYTRPYLGPISLAYIMAARGSAMSAAEDHCRADKNALLFSC